MAESTWDRLKWALWGQWAQKLRDSELKGLMQALHSSDPGERARAGVALGKHKDPRAVQLLIAVLQDRSCGYGPRVFAALGLGYSGDPRALEPLLSALRDPDRDMRHNVVLALGELGDPRAMDPLRALRDPDQKVQRGLAHALQQISAKAPRIPATPPTRPPGAAYRDGDMVSCGKCGRRIQVKFQDPGKIVMASLEAVQSIALRCQDCGFVVCHPCALGSSGEGIPVCPSCKSRGGPYMFTR